jgi:hypothetical protein
MFGSRLRVIVKIAGSSRDITEGIVTVTPSKEAQKEEFEMHPIV